MYWLINRGNHPTYSKNMTRDEFLIKLQEQRGKNWRFNDRFNENSIMLYKRLCAFNPSDRYSAATALAHPWITRDKLGVAPLTLM